MPKVSCETGEKDSMVMRRKSNTKQKRERGAGVGMPIDLCFKDEKCLTHDCMQLYVT